MVQLRTILMRIANGVGDERLLPSPAAVREIGDFGANRARLRQTLEYGRRATPTFFLFLGPDYKGLILKYSKQRACLSRKSLFCRTLRNVSKVR